MVLLLILLSFLLTRLLLPLVASLLTKGGAVRENYIGRNIPIGMGLVTWLAVIPLLVVYGKLVGETDYFLFSLILTITILVGFLDDLLGNHQVKGLKGHLLKLFHDGQLTTGALKAITISLFSFLTSWLLTGNFIEVIINFFLLILTTNSFNLLDLRPGRVIKVYFLLAMLLVLLYPASRFFLGVFLASLFSYASWDLKGRVMLGDAGSNFLGMSIGLVLVTNLGQGSKVILFFFLAYLHYYTEQKSLSALIERYSLLRFIDKLGRQP